MPFINNYLFTSFQKYPIEDAYETRTIYYSIKPNERKKKPTKESELSNEELIDLYSDNLKGDEYNIK